MKAKYFLTKQHNIILEGKYSLTSILPCYHIVLPHTILIVLQQVCAVRAEIEKRLKLCFSSYHSEGIDSSKQARLMLNAYLLLSYENTIPRKERMGRRRKTYRGGFCARKECKAVKLDSHRALLIIDKVGYCATCVTPSIIYALISTQSGASAYTQEKFSQKLLFNEHVRQREELMMSARNNHKLVERLSDNFLRTKSEALKIKCDVMIYNCGIHRAKFMGIEREIKKMTKKQAAGARCRQLEVFLREFYIKKSFLKIFAP